MSKILLPGSSLKGSISIIDLDIRVGFGTATVVEEGVLTDPRLQPFIKNGDIIVEEYDFEKRRGTMPYGPHVKATALFYGDHKVAVRKASGSFK